MCLLWGPLHRSNELADIQEGVVCDVSPLRTAVWWSGEALTVPLRCPKAHWIYHVSPLRAQFGESWGLLRRSRNRDGGVVRQICHAIVICCFLFFIAFLFDPLAF